MSSDSPHPSPPSRSYIYCQTFTDHCTLCHCVCTWAVCGFPPEYCEFGSSLTRCKGWLKKTHPALYEKYYSGEALHSKLGNLSIEQQVKLEKSTAEKKADAALKKMVSHIASMPLLVLDGFTHSRSDVSQASQVSIKRIERNKRKCVTAIHGLEALDVDLKKAAKFLAQKYATGASVTKHAQGQDEMVVQGDVSEVLELVQAGKGVFAGVPATNVEIVNETHSTSSRALL
ncbi:hypothetical protein ID866_11542 [Astraeus odoratus]|nr:hypothetical protein ID866_11542 [Astraeus odoratus]